MSAMRRAFIVTVCLILVATAATAKDKPVTVDCARGDRINAALASEDTPLVIEFSGACAEDVRIARDDVTLRGIFADAAIIGAPAAAVPAPAVSVSGTKRVSLEHFA